MGSQQKNIVLRCYIKGSGAAWTALCVDLDIAAQGRTMSEAKGVMEEMIESYLETVFSYAPEERDRFLSRKASLTVRLRLAVEFFVSSFFATPAGDDRIALISHHPCPV